MRSVRTTFQVLDAVADGQPIGLSELARRLALPKSTVQRSLATLAELGWIRSDSAHSGRWTLGERVQSLGEKVDGVGRLRDAALSVLGNLNSETLETVHLAVPEARSMRLVERRDSKHALRLVQAIGTRSPLHASSTGKSVLAYLPDTDIEAYLEEGLQRVTANTITDPDGLRIELKSIRERGYAVADGELTDGITSVAASVRPADGGRPLAAISVSGPTARMTPDLRSVYGQKVALAAAEVAARLRC